MHKYLFHVFVESLRRTTPPRRRTRGLKLRGYSFVSHESPIWVRCDVGDIRSICYVYRLYAKNASKTFLSLAPRTRNSFTMSCSTERWRLDIFLFGPAMRDCEPLLMPSWSSSSPKCSISVSSCSDVAAASISDSLTPARLSNRNMLRRSSAVKRHSGCDS